MGPRSIDRGNDWLPHVDVSNLPASMGPRSIDRGNSWRSSPSRSAIGSFNGAAVDRPRKYGLRPGSRKAWPVLQWGRGRSTAEIRLPRPVRCHATVRFNGAAVDRPRKFYDGRPPRSVLPRFNGAAVDRPRKCWRASSTDCRWVSFNGAAVDRPRKFEKSPAAAAFRRARFNGAAVDRPRKCMSSPDLTPQIQSLQWGRGRSTAEIRVAWVALYSFSKLQWGRGRSTAEILSPPAAGTVVQLASMGPRSIDRGNRAVCRQLPRQAAASMGPRSIDRGNPQDRHPLPKIALPLQWGRGRSTAEIRRELLVTRQRIVASMGPRSIDRGNIL